MTGISEAYNHTVRKLKFFSLSLCFFLALSCLSMSPAYAKYAAIIMDAASGEIYHAENIDTRNYPASMTKMMTLYLLFDELEAGRMTLSTPIKISSYAASMEPSKLGLRPGSTIRAEDAILALITKSANDIAVAVGEHISGTERKFAQRMTRKARSLGMTRTSFRNASGLPNKGQLSTARDMAKLSVALIYNHNKYYHYFSRTQFSYQGRTYRGHNKLLKTYEGMDGLKTGYIRASGFNLAASAKRKGRRLIGVVFGGKTSAWRNAHMAKLMDKGFRLAPAGWYADIPPRHPSHQYAAIIPDQPIPTTKPETMIAMDKDGLTSLFISTAHAATTAPVPSDPPKVKVTALENVPFPPRAPAAALPEGQSALPESWGIQIGAYKSEATSNLIIEQALVNYPKELQAAIPQISTVNTGKTIFYRARLMGIDQQTAKQLCAQFMSRGKSCLELPPIQ